MQFPAFTYLNIAEIVYRIRFLWHQTGGRFCVFLSAVCSYLPLRLRQRLCLRLRLCLRSRLRLCLRPLQHRLARFDISVYWSIVRSMAITRAL